MPKALTFQISCKGNRHVNNNSLHEVPLPHLLPCTGEDIHCVQWPHTVPACTVHNGVAASFFPEQVRSIQFARDVEFSIFAEAERLV